tara:strand:- start:269 stop:697 length:429 start_codon:yes stop_codon:yes gene_type:complete
MSEFINNFFGTPNTKPKRKSVVKSKTQNPAKTAKTTSSKVVTQSGYVLEKIAKSKIKKYDAFFTKPNGKTKIVSFGNASEKDFTQSGDKKMKEFFDFKNKDKLKTSHILSPAALEKHILWNKSSIEKSTSDYRKMLKVAKIK